ncbi:MAG: hypothetical protein QM703_27195 [Gemmatales bacterium]
MVYIDETDWLDIITNKATDLVAAEHIIALAKLRTLVVTGVNGWEYLPELDDDSVWRKVPYVRNI